MRISAYGTSDGAIFRDCAMAKAHQAWLDLLGMCIVQVERLGEDDGMASGDQEEVKLAQWLVRSRTELIPLMREAGRNGRTAPSGGGPPEDFGGNGAA